MSAEPELDIERVLCTLDAHGVRFVLIGGQAALLHGAPLPSFDLDLCYSRSSDNLKRLTAALTDLGATLRGAPRGLPFQLHAETLRAGDSFTFSTDAGPVDVLATPSGTSGYDELRVNAETFVVAGLTISVASIEDLIRMKTAAGRRKDLLAVEELGALQDELEGRPERE